MSLTVQAAVLREAGGPVSDGRGWLLRGDTHLDEVRRLLDVDLPEVNAETLSGLVMATSGRLPDPGDRVYVPRPDTDVLEELSVDRILRTEVRRVDRRVPALVHVEVETVLPEDPDSEADTSTGSAAADAGHSRTEGRR